MTHPTDYELLSAFARRDDSAFDRFYARHASAVHAAAVRLLHDESQAEEMMQDVFFLAARKWRKITYVQGSARSWLLGSCFNLAANRQRTARRRPVETRLPASAPTIPDMDELEAQVELRLRMSVLDGVVAEMDPMDQLIYRAAFIEGSSHVQTASDLNVTAEQVRKRVQRIRERLQPLLEEQQ